MQRNSGRSGFAILLTVLAFSTAIFTTGCGDLKAELEATKGKIAELSSKNNDLSEQVAKLSKEIKAAKDELARVTKGNESISSEIDKLKGMKSEFASQISRMKKESKDVKDQTEKLKGETSQLSKELELLTKRVSEVSESKPSSPLPTEGVPPTGSRPKEFLPETSGEKAQSPGSQVKKSREMESPCNALVEYVRRGNRLIKKYKGKERDALLAKLNRDFAERMKTAPDKARKAAVGYLKQVSSWWDGKDQDRTYRILQYKNEILESCKLDYRKYGDL